MRPRVFFLTYSAAEACKCGHVQALAGSGHPDLVTKADLEEANRRVADARRRIAEQEARFERLELDEHDTAAAIQLLAAFETALELMINYRDVLQKALQVLPKKSE